MDCKTEIQVILAQRAEDSIAEVGNKNNSKRFYKEVHKDVNFHSLSLCKKTA